MQPAVAHNLYVIMFSGLVVSELQIYVKLVHNTTLVSESSLKRLWSVNWQNKLELFAFNC